MSRLAVALLLVIVGAVPAGAQEADFSPTAKYQLCSADSVVCAATPVRAEARGFTCNVSGAVSVHPGLKNPSPGYVGEPYKVKMEGEVTGCQSTDPSLESGEIKGFIKGEGTCVYRSGEGTATVKWSNGNTTTFALTATDEAAVVQLRMTTMRSDEPATVQGDSGISVVALDADAEKCNTAEGAGDATFEGQMTSGSPA